MNRFPDLFRGSWLVCFINGLSSSSAGILPSGLSSLSHRSCGLHRVAPAKGHADG